MQTGGDSIARASGPVPGLWGAHPSALAGCAPSTTYGPRGQATVVLCTGASRLSTRTTGQVRAELLSVPMRVGTISHLEHGTSQVVAEPGQEAHASVAAQAVA